MRYSDAGIIFTSGFEGLRLEAYQDVKGVWTIGYGHTKGVHAGMACTKEQALEWLREDIGWAEMVVKSEARISLNQNQFDALVDFVYNVGSGNFRRSELLRLVNVGDLPGAAGQFALFDHAGGKFEPGLLRRRDAEAALFRK